MSCYPEEWFSREDRQKRAHHILENGTIVHPFIDRSATKHRPYLELRPISLPFLQGDVSEEHKNGTVDGSKAGEILRSLVTLGNTECVKAETEAIIEADADAGVRMLTGSSGASSGGRVSHERRR